MILAKRGINPPKSKVVNRTTTRVELTMRPELGESDGLIYRLSAKAIAPRMLPENHINISYLIDMLVWNWLHRPTIKDGKKTPMALAIMHDSMTAKKNEKLNFSYSMPYMQSPR